MGIHRVEGKGIDKHEAGEEQYMNNLLRSAKPEDKLKTAEHE